MSENHNAHIMSSLHDYHVTRNINADDHVRLHYVLRAALDLSKPGIWHVILQSNGRHHIWSKLSQRWISKQECDAEQEWFRR